MGDLLKRVEQSGLQQKKASSVTAVITVFRLIVFYVWLGLVFHSGNI